jgi:hypothetical protein
VDPDLAELAQVLDAVASDNARLYRPGHDQHIAKGERRRLD